MNRQVNNGMHKHVNLTVKALDKIARSTPTTRTEYVDEHTRGLILRHSPSGVMAWNAVYRIAGRRKKQRLTLGRFPAVPLAEARQLAAATLLTAARGDDPAAPKRAERAAPTFGMVAAEYLERHASKKKSGDEDRRMLEREVLPKWADYRARDVSRADVIRLLDAKAETAPIRANRLLALVRKVFNWAISRGLLEQNPCAHVPRPGKETSRDRVLTASEIRAVWTGLDKAKFAAGTRLALKLCLVTAQRAGEVASLEWSEIDGDWWTIPSAKAKNGDTHRVFLSPLAKRLLEEAKVLAGEDAQFVFPSPTSAEAHVERNALSHAVRRNLAALGVVRFTPHDLRRTAASHMTSAGTPRLVVSKILNHADSEITAVYDRHSYDAEKRAALERWSGLLTAIVTNEKVVTLASRAA